MIWFNRAGVIVVSPVGSHPLTYIVATKHASGRLPRAPQVSDMQKNNKVKHIILYKEYEKLFELENGRTHWFTQTSIFSFAGSCTPPSLTYHLYALFKKQNNHFHYNDNRMKNSVTSNELQLLTFVTRWWNFGTFSIFSHRVKDGNPANSQIDAC